MKGKHAFERIEMSKDEALEMFKYNDFKIDVLKRKVLTPHCLRLPTPALGSRAQLGAPPCSERAAAAAAAAVRFEVVDGVEGVGVCLWEQVPDGAQCTAYRCGDLIDLCRGPHVPDTSRVKAFSVMKNSSAYWQGQVSPLV